VCNTVLQVIEDLSSYASKAQGGYSPYPMPGPMPPIRAPAGPGVAEAGPRPRSKRSLIPCALFRCWPFPSGGTDTHQIFRVTVAYLTCQLHLLRLSSSHATRHIGQQLVAISTGPLWHFQLPPM